MAFYELEPFGDVRADLRAGMIASPLLNIQLSKNAKRTSPSDWIYQSDPSEPQTPEQMKMILKGLADAAKSQETRKAKRLQTRRREPK